MIVAILGYKEKSTLMYALCQCTKVLQFSCLGITTEWVHYIQNTLIIFHWLSQVHACSCACVYSCVRACVHIYVRVCVCVTSLSYVFWICVFDYLYSSKCILSILGVHCCFVFMHYLFMHYLFIHSVSQSFSQSFIHSFIANHNSSNHKITSFHCSRHFVVFVSG